MANRPRSRHFGAPKKRWLTWLSVDISESTLASAAAITHTMSTAEKAKRPFTVLRTRIELNFRSDQTGALETQLGAFGLCVVTDQAVGIGVSAVPTPATDIESDAWFVHQVLLNEFLFITGAGIAENAGRRYVIDSKAKRKVNDDEQVIIVAENLGAGGGQVLSIGGRILIQEH